MAEAKQAGGFYYVNGVAVDAEGKEIEGAPKQDADTPPEKQPGAPGAPSADPFQRLADTITTALGGKSAGASASGSAGGEEAGLPTLADLSDHIAKMSASEVRALQRTDDRKGAVPIYEARLAELE